MQNESPFDPENRQLYTDILRPPKGYHFDCAVATTFSLDFETALAIPAAIVFQDAENREDILKSPLALLEGIERVADRIAIYCDHGRIKGAKPATSRLMALFENSIKEVVAPGRGAFHPKMWCLRFEPEERDEPIKMRCVILSRNLTCDRSWDLSLCLEGTAANSSTAVNDRLVSLIQALPSLARDDAHKIAPDFIEKICEDLSHCKWDLPVGAKSISFSVNGIDNTCWPLPQGERLVVISPFISGGALKVLQAGLSVEGKCELISRSEELDQVSDKARNRFFKLWTLREDDLEEENGDEDGAGLMDNRGLHAKAYLVEKGDKITLSIGSANATRAALIPGKNELTKNVEIIASLAGAKHKMGGIDEFIFSSGFFDILAEYNHSEPLKNVEQIEAEKTLEALQAVIARIPFSIDCEPIENKKIKLVLHKEGLVEGELFEGLKCQIRVLSSENQHGQDAMPFLVNPEEIFVLGEFSLEDVSRWIVVRLSHIETETIKTFTLGTTLKNLPEGRDAALRRAMIANTDGFFSYLQLLLGFASSDNAISEGASAAGGWAKVLGRGDSSLLEPLLRSLHTGGQELSCIDRLMEDLKDSESGESIVPEEFQVFWENFRPFLDA